MSRYRRGKRRKVEIWTVGDEYVGTKDSLSEAAKECDVVPSSVSGVLSGRLNSANGYIFKEVKENR